MKSMKLWLCALVLVGAVVVGIRIMPSLGHDDQALAMAMVGTWIATDPTDNALHRREEPVVGEKLVFRDDDTLTHSVVLESKPDEPEDDQWGWMVRKGRLFVKFLGAEGTGQWLPSFPFSVDDHTLAIRVQGRPAKKFTRP